MSSNRDSSANKMKKRINYVSSVPLATVIDLLLSLTGAFLEAQRLGAQDNSGILTLISRATVT